MAKVQQVSPQQQARMQNMAAMQANLQARQIVLNESYPITQNVETRTFVPKQQSTFDVTPANIGIIKGFIVNVTAKIKKPTDPDVVFSLTRFGMANIIRNLTYFDPDNQRHTQTTGWHLHFVNSIKQGRPFLACTQYQQNVLNTPNTGYLTYPVPYANTFKVNSAPAQISSTTADADLEVSFMYYVPLAYSENDLTGAVLANIPQSKQRLKLEFSNENTFSATSGESDVDAVYKGNDPALKLELEEMSYTVYQCYLDQLPQGENGYILPLIDLSTLYCLENTVAAGLTQNVDFTVQYANLYKYLSTFAVYDNGEPQFNGADVNYLSQRTANFSDTRKLDPVTWAANTRKMFGSDFPASVYYCDNRDKPIYTLQYGNVSFVINPKTVNSSNSRLLLGYEYMTSRTELINAGTIATS